MGVKITQQGSECIALLEGDIDHHTAKAMREIIDDHITQKRPNTLYLDFGRVSFMDSSGIGLIMGRYKNIRLLGGKLWVVGTSSSMKRIIKLSGLGALGVMKEDE
ncbi:MAG: anti-sigma factor antagonist [Oscillospiraceae bacterium]|jgi:stage II sporulation protein AA (anti-sigma F factor antagonist)|nr:anti-sigma factor antagonist [Oscillospiraceae bacterium]